MQPLTQEKASALLNAALKKARELSAKPMGVAVLDAGGHLLAYQREDGATHLRFNIAFGKAWGAIALGMNSRKFAEMAQDRPAFIAALDTMTEGKIVPSAGGVLIKDKSGVTIGAIGISGDLPDIDEECAMAALEALL